MMVTVVHLISGFHSHHIYVYRRRLLPPKEHAECCSLHQGKHISPSLTDWIQPDTYHELGCTLGVYTVEVWRMGADPCEPAVLWITELKNIEVFPEAHQVPLETSEEPMQLGGARMHRQCREQKRGKDLLSLSEQNYGVGDRELLAMKLALEEWRHWLEGARHPFTVITDHKNLEYLQTTKRLNSRQARWFLFFSRIVFRVTYRLGEKRADELSQQHHAEAQSSSQEPVLPPSCFLAAVTWDIDRSIEAMNPHPQCPA
ncbi:hypothetical protein P4O66_001627 [Electrophorus voltai]|uniref:Reverse transcriptase RNase H-like domain-containing protein n=1 Tax=Electrophorus voltai TaxID=2609070 RepID=A0AAD8Z5C4_9TELE|nr:hypothetical protein P4O66_001627 [Electrophorus voltai]